MRALSTLLLLAAIAGGFPAVALADQTRVELTDPTKPVALEVEIEWGAIEIIGDAEADHLTIESRADRPDEINGGQITVNENGNLVTVRQAPLKSGSFRSANLEIRTPIGSQVTLQVNRGGDIAVTGIRGLIEITNLNGSVELAGISGAAAVNASNGAIIAGFNTVDPQSDMIFTSLNGSVELCLPATFSARVRLTTAGDPIRSDFPIDRLVPVRTVSPGQTVTVAQSEVIGSIGSSEGDLRVSTLNGEIYLERCD